MTNAYNQNHHRIGLRAYGRLRQVLYADDLQPFEDRSLGCVVFRHQQADFAFGLGSKAMGKAPLTERTARNCHVVQVAVKILQILVAERSSFGMIRAPFPRGRGDGSKPATDNCKPIRDQE
jgi:hypothetical protein